MPNHAAKQPAPGHPDGANREVKVWVRDVNGMRYRVKVPVSSDFDDVMRRVREENGPIPGIRVGFKGGKEVGGWDERTTVSDMLPDANKRPADFNEEDYLFEHPIEPKFKKECLIL